MSFISAERVALRCFISSAIESGGGNRERGGVSAMYRHTHIGKSISTGFALHSESSPPLVIKSGPQNTGAVSFHGCWRREGGHYTTHCLTPCTGLGVRNTNISLLPLHSLGMVTLMTSAAESTDLESVTFAFVTSKNTGL